ncbi:MAG: bifunctional aspartate kinase/homoserine dehydrogenase I [Bacteroidales bacterium]|nr:bifunctional aspartate kinase/homoserine dehydrogenase I [Bacteroidales bacterium]
MQVLKFGGTSLADADLMESVVRIVEKALEEDRTIVVCSAIAGCTDKLIEIGGLAAKQDTEYVLELEKLKKRHTDIVEKLLPPGYQHKTLKQVNSLFERLGEKAQGVFLLGELSAPSLSAIQSYGELLATCILNDKLQSLGLIAKVLNSQDLVLIKSNTVDTEVTFSNIRKAVEDQPHTELFLVPGYIGRDSANRAATLGRGGSDYTASIFAAGLHARKVEIWTDVPGIMTADPKVVPTAKPIAHISYRAAQELSHFGAKVIYPPTIQPIVNEGIPIFVKNTFSPGDPGTQVEKNPPKSGEGVVGIAHSEGISLISLEGSGMVGVPGFSSRLFDALAKEGINIILITQSSSVYSMCIAISDKDADRAKKAADEVFAYEISLGKLNPLKVESTKYSIVCLIGDHISGNSGTTGRMLAALGRHSIPVRATAQGSSERNISVIVPSVQVHEAIRAIHHEFFDRFTDRVIPLFVAGYGRVGKALIEMLRDNAASIAKRSGKELRVCGIARSKKYVINTEGIDLSKAAELIENGSTGSYIDALSSLSLENPIFVDCTASEETGFRYPDLFGSGFSVVACNKIPFSGTYAQFRNLQKEAKKAGVSLRYETTAGAALPILVTLDRVLQSGDKLVKMEAVLSGTLNYLLDNYQGEGWDELVESAHRNGYTEPDPSIDLSGKDVLRKILILSRQAGIHLEESQVQLEAIPADIADRYKGAKKAGKKLRYVASVDAGGHAKVGLEEVGPDSPLYALKGTDNAVLITTGDYPSPMLIQGAGAGTRQTAGGLLNDILLSLYR